MQTIKFNKLDLKEDDLLLDMGCGEGRHTIGAYIEMPVNSFGFDLSFEDDATQSVVLIKDGVLIAERYADGYDKDSFGTSWSMAKSFYAALILISVDKGEIGSLDDKVSKYLDYFNDDRSVITIRQLLNMSSGLEYPETQHEMMFFQPDHLEYSKQVKLEKDIARMESRKETIYESRGTSALNLLLDSLVHLFLKLDVPSFCLIRPMVP